MALPNDRKPYNPNISSRRLNRDIEFIFDRGWSPVLKPVVQENAVYLQLIEWIGGEGDKPFDPTANTYYLGDNGFVTDINQAINIAEHLLADDLKEFIIKADTMTIELVKDVVNIILRIEYDTLDGVHHLHQKVIMTDYVISDNDRLNNNDLTGVTRRAISETIYNLKNWIIIDDWQHTPVEHNRALSQYAVLQAIEEAKAKFDVPIVDLTTDLIIEVEGTYGLSSDNPYYMIVAEDDRTDGRHTPNCTITCLQQCCDLNEDGGYYERGNREGITGCRCDPGQEEVLAVCRVTVTALGNVGDRYEIWLNGLPYTFYEVQNGDITQDVVNGLIANLPNQCTSGRDCDVTNITNNSFDLVARPGSGSTPNSWNKQVYTTGTAGATFTQIVQGQDYLQPTWRGVRHHLIAYDGSQWYDFGPTLAFGNNSENSSCECTFIYMTDTPDTYENYAGYIPIVNDDEDALVWINYTFLNLHDTPDTYIADYRLKVNNTSDAVIFVDDTFLNLNDTPNSYSGQAGMGLRVNGAEDSLEYTTIITDANNGLTNNNSVVQLGGDLIHDTNINLFNYNFEILGQSPIIRIGNVDGQDASYLIITGIDESMLFTHGSSGTGTIVAHNMGFELSYSNNSNYARIRTDTGSGFKMFIEDNINHRGIEYADDYSDNYTERSLVDKGYVNFGEYVPVIDCVTAPCTIVDNGLSYYQKVGKIVYGSNTIRVQPGIGTLIVSISLPIDTDTDKVHVIATVREESTTNTFIAEGYGDNTSFTPTRIVLYVLGDLDNSKIYKITYTYTYKIE